MKVLVLSCATGGGHNACGAGIAEALTDCGHVADFMPNYLALHGKLVDLNRHRPSEACSAKR